jgi:hypothetical protein
VLLAFDKGANTIVFARILFSFSLFAANGCKRDIEVTAYTVNCQKCNEQCVFYMAMEGERSNGGAFGSIIDDFRDILYSWGLLGEYRFL